MNSNLIHKKQSSKPETELKKIGKWKVTSDYMHYIFIFIYPGF